MSGPPNILLIMADQMAAPFVSPWGGPALTPHLQRLSDEGVTFESTYSNSPLCAPARFAMMAGQRNSRIGAYDNASEFASSIPTFAHHLRSAGYQTSLVGKMHFVGPDQLHGFEERLTTDIYPADFGWTPNWLEPDGRFDWWFHNLDSVTHAGVADVTNQLDFDDEVGFKAVRKLRDLARTSDDRPWMVTASFTHPHDPYVARPEYWDRYDPDDIALPTVAAGDAPTDPHSERLKHVICADVTDVSDDDVRRARHAYLANCSYIDDQVGRLVETLETHGMADDTIVVFTADHGDLLGERGLWYKMSFFEGSARVPLIVHAPTRFPARRSTTLTSLLDIAPTLLDLAEAPIPESFDGHALLAQLGGDEDAERVVEGEFLGEGAIAPIVMLREASWKYVVSEPDGEQLYDLRTDPLELANLSDSPDVVDRLDSFRGRVADTWDLEAVHRDVLASQADRRTVHDALAKGRYCAWDFQPTSDASVEFMRNHLDLNDVERGRRAP
ncbi:MAG: choline-sulfatase [Actinomycetota bacterium]